MTPATSGRSANSAAVETRPIRFVFALLVCCLQALFLNACGDRGGSISTAPISLQVPAANPTALVGSTVQCKAHATYSNGTAHDATTNANWNSLNRMGATVSTSVNAAGTARAANASLLYSVLYSFGASWSEFQ